MMLALLPDLLDGDTAIRTAKEALLAFEVKGPFRIQGLAHQTAEPGPKYWKVAVSAPDGTAYEAFLRPEGRLYSLARRPSRPPSRSASPGDAARAARWLAKVGPRFALRPSTANFGPDTQAFEAVVEGHPFVSPTYGYRFTLARGRFVAFNADERIPPLGPRVPRLSENDALQRARPILRREFDVPRRVEYRKVASLGLAWLETAASPRAALVWRILASPTLLAQDWSAIPSSVEIDLDAQTGARLTRRPPG